MSTPIADVKAYRAYLRDAADHIVRPIEITSSSDERALEEARQYAGKYSVEVWDRTRKVGSFSGSFRGRLAPV